MAALARYAGDWVLDTPAGGGTPVVVTGTVVLGPEGYRFEYDQFVLGGVALPPELMGSPDRVLQMIRRDED